MHSESDFHFFSIIVPAHNEEKYIVSTLEHIKNLNYPKDRFEVFVVENGSTDNTYALAKEFESRNITVFTVSKRGVSHAKNHGIDMISPKSEWTVILDADTHIKSNFLGSLNKYFSKKSSQIYSVGTTYVKPIHRSLKATLWFGFYDMGHRLIKASYSIQIVKTSVLKQFRFNENLSIGEDLELIKFSRQSGKFFVFRTNEVFTSTRRFEDEGWFNLFLVWTFVAALPKYLKRRFSYKVVR